MKLLHIGAPARADRAGAFGPTGPCVHRTHPRSVWVQAWQDLERLASPSPRTIALRPGHALTLRAKAACYNYSLKIHTPRPPR